MKRYIWIVSWWTVATGVYALENPFDLNTNLQKLEEDQQALLKDLQKEAKILETIQEVSNDTEIDADDDEIKKTSSVAKHKTKTKTKVKVKESKSTFTAIQTTPDQKRNEKNKIMATQPLPQEVIENDKIKAEQAKINVQQKVESQPKTAKEKAKQEKEALARLKAEREAAEKRAKEAALADINITKEQMEAAKRSEEELRNAIVEVDQDD